MTTQDPNDESKQHRRESRQMWIITIGGIAIILAMMGAGMLFNHDSGTPTEISSQSAPQPEAK